MSSVFFNKTRGCIGSIKKLRKEHVDSKNLISFKPTSKRYHTYNKRLKGSTCLASSIDNFELPSNSSSGYFRFPSSNACEKATSETDLAHNVKMPKHSGEPRTEKLPICNFSSSIFLGSFHFLGVDGGFIFHPFLETTPKVTEG